MNDSDLGTAVRAAVADIHADTPVEMIISRGAGLRARRRVPIAAGAVAAAAGTAVAVTTLATGQAGMAVAGHQALASSSAAASRHAAGVQLAAWTVARQSDGDIEVTINQLRDPAGLQATLRADGLPVTVSFSGPVIGPSCQGYPASLPTLTSVAEFHPDGITIDPSALPKGIGLAIFDAPGTGLPSHPAAATAPSGAPRLHPSTGSLLHGLDGPLAVSLVDATPGCTG